ncbi:MAG: PLP-dependent aminotransferase family protein [Nannocystaceae bacterium]|nr:PLP-dependent aminotransferase family protein [Nannocystaceae bacterium]
MARWPVDLELPETAGPRYASIATGIIAAIRGGRLRAGDRLPPTRVLAARLGVHRNTVVAAYRELATQGWIDASHGRGTFVGSPLPRAPTAARPRRVPQPLGFALPRSELAPHEDEPPGVPARYRLDVGLPDPRQLPVTMLGRALRRALALRESCEYGGPCGHPRLREQLAVMLRDTRGLAIEADAVMVTRGSQMAIDLVARTLLRPGDVVAVEDPGYRPAWDALRGAGAELLPIAVDRDGLDVAALAAVCARRAVRMVYLTPHHHFPTLVTLSPARRLALLELARARRMIVLEDDYDHEFHYGSRPPAPLASHDVANVVVYVATLSKVVAPGLRSGCVVAPPPLVRALAAVRTTMDRSGDPVLERALAELLEDGEIARHVRRMRKLQLERRDAAAAALTRSLAGAVRFELPAGGMALWLEVDPAIDLESWRQRAREHGVAIGLGRHFAFAPSQRTANAVRLGYSRHTPGELHAAIARLADALPRTRGRRAPARTAAPRALR